MFIDTHAHLFADEFENDRHSVVENAILGGITKMYLPNIDSQSIPKMLKLSKAFPHNCFPTMGLHPCSVNNMYNDELQIVEHWLSRQKFYAVGEIGIDLFWDITYKRQQEDAFSRQIELAKKYDLPIIIHTRNSFDVAYEIVREQNTSKLKGVFHCFTGTANDAEKIISLGGFMMGIGGVLTFKNSGLDSVVKNIDLNYLVLETDSPYLAPVPYRGKRNESNYLKIIAQKLAEIKNTTIDTIAEITTKNANKIFNNK